MFIVALFEDAWTILKVVPRLALSAMIFSMFLYYIFKEPD